MTSKDSPWNKAFLPTTAFDYYWRLSCYRARRTGERKRKSVRGCIVGSDLSVLNLVVVKKGDLEIPDLTDNAIPRRLGPKRANKIRKLFDLEKTDDVRKFVITRTLTKLGKNGKPIVKRPRIQRLVTPVVLARKRHRIAEFKADREKSKADLAAYSAMLHKRVAEQNDARRSEISRRRSSRKLSTKKE